MLGSISKENKPYEEKCKRYKKNKKDNKKNKKQTGNRNFQIKTKRFLLESCWLNHNRKQSERLSLYHWDYNEIHGKDVRHSIVSLDIFNHWTPSQQTLTQIQLIAR